MTTRLSTRSKPVPTHGRRTKRSAPLLLNDDQVKLRESPGVRARTIDLNVFAAVKAEIESKSGMSETTLDSASHELQVNSAVFCMKAFGQIPDDPTQYFEDMLWEWYWSAPRWDFLGAHLNGLSLNQLFLVYAWTLLRDGKYFSGPPDARGHPVTAGFAWATSIAAAIHEAEFAPGYRS